MPLQISVSALYASDPDGLFDQATDFADLIGATRKISTYKGLPPVRMIQGETYRTDITTLGLIRCKDYSIHIKRLCPDIRIMESLESNSMIRLWSHHLRIEPHGTGSRWTDEVLIDAGYKTHFVARYARFMYKLRHKERGGTFMGSEMYRPSRVINPDIPVFHPAE